MPRLVKLGNLILLWTMLMFFTSQLVQISVKHETALIQQGQDEGIQGDFIIRNLKEVKPEVDTCENVKKTKSVDDLDLIGERPETVHNWGWGPIPKQCQNKTYNISSELKATVIMSFHRHENLTNVIRTVHSIVKRTPPRLLEGILLIDDGSQKGDEVTVMMNYLRMMYPLINVQLLAMAVNVGLIQTRLLGIREAKGPVVVILDSHMEVQEKWLEPLLQEIQKDRRTMVATITDVITPTEKVTPSGIRVWQYDHMASELRTYMDWSLLFGSVTLTEEERKSRLHDQTQPIRTPVIIGNFAIDKTFFEEVGAYDPGMEQWGGENVDLPLRVWLSGGSVYNIPCSHTAHLEFRGIRDYRFNRKSEALRIRNYKRVVETMFGHYKKYFYRSYPEAKDMEVDVTDRLDLVKKFPHDIDWFLTNVSPGLGVPEKQGFAWDGPVHVETGQCLRFYWGTGFVLGSCDDIRRQEFFWSKDGTLRNTVEIVRVVPGQGHKLDMEGVMAVFGSEKNSKWTFWKEGPLLEQRTGLCIDIEDKSRIILDACDPLRRAQRWTFKKYTAVYEAFMNGSAAKINQELYNHIRKTREEWSRVTNTPPN